MYLEIVNNIESILRKKYRLLVLMGIDVAAQEILKNRNIYLSHAKEIEELIKNTKQNIVYVINEGKKREERISTIKYLERFLEFLQRDRKPEYLILELYFYNIFKNGSLEVMRSKYRQEFRETSFIAYGLSLIMSESIMRYVNERFRHSKKRRRKLKKIYDTLESKNKLESEAIKILKFLRTFRELLKKSFSGRNMEYYLDIPGLRTDGFDLYAYIFGQIIENLEEFDFNKMVNTNRYVIDIYKTILKVLLGNKILRKVNSDIRMHYFYGHSNEEIAAYLLLGIILCKIMGCENIIKRDLSQYSSHRIFHDIHTLVDLSKAYFSPFPYRLNIFDVLEKYLPKKPSRISLAFLSLQRVFGKLNGSDELKKLKINVKIEYAKEVFKELLKRVGYRGDF